MNTKCGFCFGQMSLVLEHARLNTPSGVERSTPTCAHIPVKHFYGKDFFPTQRLIIAINHIKMAPEIEGGKMGIYLSAIMRTTVLEKILFL